MEGGAQRRPGPRVAAHRSVHGLLHFTRGRRQGPRFGCDDGSPGRPRDERSRVVRGDSRHDDIVVGVLSGEIDLSNATELEALITEAVPNTVRGLVLDLSDSVVHRQLGDPVAALAGREGCGGEARISCSRSRSDRRAGGCSRWQGSRIPWRSRQPGTQRGRGSAQTGRDRYFTLLVLPGGRSRTRPQMRPRDGRHPNATTTSRRARVPNHRPRIVRGACGDRSLVRDPEPTHGGW